LKVFLLGPSDAPYAITGELNMSESASKVAVRRFGKRCRQLFREAIADPAR
jgi:hypothetical protein